MTVVVMVVELKEVERKEQAREASQVRAGVSIELDVTRGGSSPVPIQRATPPPVLLLPPHADTSLAYRSLVEGTESRERVREVCCHPTAYHSIN
ncbi:hypothetical protein O3P69_015804 [Scylla paramamosain]|uniref:Uncharacterized protein n=1 Tax=Scylla paramamosain TaxID=85552 RepID=A0AAW0T868_SCYPA